MTKRPGPDRGTKEASTDAPRHGIQAKAAPTAARAVAAARAGTAAACGPRGTVARTAAEPDRVAIRTVGRPPPGVGERRRAGRRSEDRRLALLAEIVESASDAIMATNADRRFVLWNRGAEALYGWTAAEALGQGPELLRTELTDAEKAAIYAEIEAGRPWRGRVIQYHRDGSRRVVYGVASRFVRPDDEVVYFSINRDVTELVAQHEQIELQAELLDVITEAVIAAGPDMRINFWNRGAEAMFGWSSAEMLGRLGEETDPEFSPADRDAMLAAIQATGHWQGDAVRRRKDGTAFVNDLTITARVAPDGTPLGFVAVGRDVTERKRLERIRDMYARLLEGAQDAVVGVDVGRRIVVWNRGAERTYGWTAEEAIGQSADILRSEQSAESRAAMYAAISDEGAWRGEDIHRHRDGRPLHMDVAASSVVGDDGRPIIFGINRDVTEKVQQEAQIAFQAKLLAAVGESVVATDKDETIVYWGPGAERLYGWPADQAVGHDINELLATEFPGDDLPTIDATLHAGGSWRGDLIRHHRDGTAMVIDLAVRSRREGPGPHEGSIGVGRDVTAQRQAERELEQTAARLALLHEIDSAMLRATTPETLGQEVLPIVRRAAAADRALLSVVDADGRAEVVALEGSESRLGGVGIRYALLPSSLEWLRAGETVDMPDLGAVAHLHPMLAALSAEGIGAQATVPLRVDDALIGVLTVAWGAARPPGDGMHELLHDLTSSMSLALRQALLREQADRRTEAARSLHEVAVELRGSRTTEDLAEATLRGLERVMDFGHAAIHLVGPESGRLAPIALRDRLGSGDAARSARERTAFEAMNQPDGGGIARWVLEHGEPVRLGEAAADPRYLSVIEGVRAELCVPIRVEDRVVGVIDLESLEPEAFSADDQLLLETMAAQFGVAYENVRTLTELEERVAERTASLRQANTDLEAFNYSVSHDLRAPLRAMHGFAVALLEDEGERLSIDGRAFAGRIVGAASLMARIVDDLLAYSRVSRSELRRTPIDLDTIVTMALEQARPKIERASAHVRARSQLGRVTGHRDTLVLVVSALLDNALTYVAPGTPPIVTIRSERLASDVRLWVEDAGLGIAEDDLERIFLPLQRLHLRDAYPGTGLGLAIARRAMERMGGRVGVESSAGGGSRFWIELPALEEGR